jgi:hypothetical protein
MRLKAPFFLIAAILLVALFLRFFGIAFGLPLISNFYIRPDETLIALPAISILEHSGNPRYFGYPGLMMEISALLYQAYFMAHTLLGGTSAPSVSAHFADSVSEYVMISRCLSATFSTLTVLVVYKLAGTLVNRRGAMLAATLLAVTPLACRDAHFGVTDSLVTLCGAASIYMLARHLKTGGIKWLCAASMLLGCAFSAKYSAATLFPALFLAVLCNGNVTTTSEKIRHLAIAALVPFGVFLLFNPYVISEFGQFSGSVRMIVGILYINHSPSLPIDVVVSQALTPLKYGPAGILCIPLLAASLGYGTQNATEHRIKWLILIAFILAFLPIISAKHPMPFRYALPSLPYAAILTALGIQSIAGRFDNGLQKIVYGSFVLATVTPPLVSSVWMDVLLNRSDSRTLAGEWISKNVDRSTPVALAGWPECEPQVPETDSSILRRIDFVRRFYGEAAVPVVAQPYRMQLCNKSGATRQGYELYRTAVPVDVPGNQICLVIPTYPYTSSALRTEAAASVIDKFPGRITRKVHIETLYNTTARHDLDPIDAFYLPMDRLLNIARPGPAIDIYLISRTSRKAENKHGKRNFVRNTGLQ